MTRLCAECGIGIYRYNQSGLCKPCHMRSPARAIITRKAITNRIAAMAAWPAEQRLAKYRITASDGECWGWRGADNGEGYPVLTVGGEFRLATHIALEIDGRPRPSPLHVACHECDNPPCTNPKHLWWGTEKQNMQDAASKGRLSGWSRRPGAKRDQAQTPKTHP